MKIFKSLWAILLALFLSACLRNDPPCTPEEASARDDMMRQALEDSAPRNQNQLPKANDEFVKTYNGLRKPSCP